MTEVLQQGLERLFDIQPLTELQLEAWRRGDGIVLPDGSKPEDFVIVQLLPVWWTQVDQNGRQGTYTGWDWSEQVGPLWCEANQQDPRTGHKQRFAWWPPADLEELAVFA